MIDIDCGKLWTILGDVRIHYCCLPADHEGLHNCEFCEKSLEGEHEKVS